MTSTRHKDDLGGEARVALRGAGLAWIVMGLLTLLAAWKLSDFGTITDWWEFFWIKLTVPGRMLVLVFGLALICAGIFAWRCARWAAYVGLGLGYLWLVSAIVFLLPVFPLAILSIALGHSALWLANPRRRRGDAATMGMGGGGSRRADWIAVHGQRGSLVRRTLRGSGLGGRLLRGQRERRRGQEYRENRFIAKAHSNRCEHGR